MEKTLVKRSFTLDRADLKEDKSIDLSFSSELPVKRDIWGKTIYEVLDHSATSVDLSRLNDGAPLLWMHDPEKMIGKVDSAKIHPDRIGRATVRFGNTDFAKQVFADVKDGIASKVSVAYEILDVKEDGMINDIPRFIVTNWQPREISIVSLPADNTVGVGRCEDTNDVLVVNTPDIMKVSETKQLNTERKEETSVSPKITIGENKKTQILKRGDTQMEQMNEIEVAKLERKRINDIDATTEKMKAYVDGIRELRNKAVEDGLSAQEFRSDLMQKMKTQPVAENPNEIGLSTKEVKEYSFSRAIMAQTPNSGIRSCPEMEYSDQVAKQLGMAPKGLYVPMDIQLRGIQAKRTSYTVADNANAGYLVGTELQGQNFIELLRNKTFANAVGVQFLSGLVGNVAIPRQDSASTAYWIAENGSITVSTGSVSQVSLSPKIVGAYTDFSKKLLAQSTPSIDNLITRDLTSVLALAIDKSVLHGLGSSNEPQGIQYNTSVVSSSLATGSFSNVVSLETRIATNNADISNMYYVTNATVAGGLKTYPKQSGQPIYVMSENMTMNGYPVMRTNQVATGFLFFGDWSTVVIGSWGVLDLLIDPYTNATSNVVRVIASQMVDVAIRQPGAMTFGYGMTYFG